MTAGHEPRCCSLTRDRGTSRAAGRKSDDGWDGSVGESSRRSSDGDRRRKAKWDLGTEEPRSRREDRDLDVGGDGGDVRRKRATITVTSRT
eukprot:3065058-Rhodomonas_salina.1